MIKIHKKLTYFVAFFALMLTTPTFIFAGGGGGFTSSGDPGMANGKGVNVTYTTAAEDLPNFVGKKVAFGVFQGSNASCITYGSPVPANGVITGKCTSTVAGTDIIGLTLYNDSGSEMGTFGGITIHFTAYIAPKPTNTPTPTITPTPVATNTPTPVPPTPTPKSFLARILPHGPSSIWSWFAGLFSFLHHK